MRAGINLPSEASGGVRHCKTKLLAFDAAIESLAHALEIEKEVEQAFEEQTNKSMLIWFHLCSSFSTLLLMRGYFEC